MGDLFLLSWVGLSRYYKQFLQGGYFLVVSLPNILGLTKTNLFTLPSQWLTAVCGGKNTLYLFVFYVLVIYQFVVQILYCDVLLSCCMVDSQTTVVLATSQLYMKLNFMIFSPLLMKFSCIVAETWFFLLFMQYCYYLHCVYAYYAKKVCHHSKSTECMLTVQKCL